MPRSYMLLYKLRYFFMAVVFLVGIFLLSILVVAIGPSHPVAEAQTQTAPPLSVTEDPNAVTNGMNLAAYNFGKALDSAERGINRTAQTVASVGIQGGKSVGRGTKTGIIAIGRGVGRSVLFVGRSVGKVGLGIGSAVGGGVGFVFRVPGNVVGFVANTGIMRGILRPSDHAEVSIIDPNSPELKAAVAALPPTPPAAAPQAPAIAQNNAGPQWPIRGMVTTEFGVRHMPYQRTHTGIDISDGRRSGVTPIKPFRPGRVIDVAQSGSGLGRHVTVDHGNGVTSVYAHMSSTAVRVGQEVTLDTVLGMEGSTGVSTGTHLHLEIRVNGQAANPRYFIAGQP